MKRKSTDRTYLKRVIDRDFISICVDDYDFKGCITLFKMNKVTQDCIINYGEKNICVIDNGYKMMQYVPLNENYTLTAFCDKNNKLVQWYFDITYRNGIGDDGIPFYDDLYLDIVILPPSDIHLLDKDELDEARDTKEINDEQYNLACNVANRLMNDISNNRIRLFKRYETDLNHLLELVKR
jgi:Uncharacterized conserved protein